MVGDKEDIDSLLQSCLELLFEPDAAVKGHARRAVLVVRKGMLWQRSSALRISTVYIQALLAMIFVSFGYICIRTIGSENCPYTRIYVIAILVPVKILDDC
jgi:hypothetical protein